MDPTAFASAVTAITSAFGDPTRRQIYLHLCTVPDGATASEVATGFSLHANVARHHLDKLAAGGYLEAASDRSGSGAGRPSKRYRVADLASAFELGVRTDDVVIRLLGRALAELGTDRAEALATEVGIEYGQSMAAALGEDGTTIGAQKSVRSALHAVADALSAHGFAAHAEAKGPSLRIVSEHCPFGDTVIEHPVMCAIDRGMVQGMLGALYGETSVDVTSSKPMGDAHCVTDIDS